MVHLTMLSEMMSGDLPEAVERLRGIGIRHLDLKGGVFGRNIAELDAALTDRLAALVERTGTEVYCFSSVLGAWNVDETPEREFRSRLMGGVEAMLRTAKLVRPALIRLLGCMFARRRHCTDCNTCLPPWVYAAYREAVDRIAEVGIGVTIENEPDSILSNPAETPAFFERLDRHGKVGFTWDVQNMWQCGTFPTLEVYEVLRPTINYVHLKGGCGRSSAPTVLAWRTTLEQAWWPVRDIVGRVIADGVSPVLCLNPPHGRAPARDAEAPRGLQRYEPARDVAFLRATFPEISRAPAD